MVTKFKKLQQMRVLIGHSSDGKILSERIDEYNKIVASLDVTAERKQKLYMMGKRAANQRIKYFKKQYKNY